MVVAHGYDVDRPYSPRFPAHFVEQGDDGFLVWDSHVEAAKPGMRGEQLGKVVGHRGYLEVLVFSFDALALEFRVEIFC